MPRSSLSNSNIKGGRHTEERTRLKTTQTMVQNEKPLPGRQQTDVLHTEQIIIHYKEKMSLSPKAVHKISICMLRLQCY